MKKHKLWIFIIPLLAAIIYVLAYYVIPYAMFIYNDIWHYSADYEEYADDFNLVRDYFATEFPSETGRWIAISNEGSPGIKVFDTDTKEYVSVPGDVISSLEIIRNDAFRHKDSLFDAIGIHGDRISFCIENHHYALVYSPNEKPTWVNSPDEDDAVRVKSIGDGWYHVVKKV